MKKDGVAEYETGSDDECHRSDLVEMHELLSPFRGVRLTDT